MTQILIEHDPVPAKLEILGVYDWAVWSREVSTFAWVYDERETCYVLEGEALVTPEGGAPVRLVENDLVTFPAGMRCTWEIVAAVRKHYQLG